MALLPFQKQILAEVNEQDGLLVLARGLGLRTILLHLLRAYADPRNLVLLLNTPADEEAYYREALASTGATQGQFKVVKADTYTQDRSDLYRQGGVLSITSRMLVMDLLTDRLPASLVTGVIVNHAHRVRDTSTEAFILRLLREKNHAAFIKALSDSPESFAMGFASLEKALKALKLRHTLLWPRFHVDVAADLERAQIEVVELRLPLSQAMQEIQLAIMDCLQSCIAELRRSYKLVDLDEVTVENALSRSFDVILRQQLDAMWHRISARTKMLVADVATLRRLVTYMVDYDCVTFYEFLETLMASSTTATYAGSTPSPWLMTDAADLLFQAARNRVYRRCDTLTADQTQQLAHAGLPPRILPVLEEQPKWHLLRQILDEVHTDRNCVKQAKASESLFLPHGPILVMTNSQRTCAQLQEYLDALHARDLASLTSSKVALRSSSQRSEADDIGSTHPDAPPGFASVLVRALRGYFRWKHGVYNLTTLPPLPTPSASLALYPRTNSSQPPPTRNPQPTNKRRRVRGASTAAASSSHGRGQGAANSTSTSALPATTSPTPDSQESLAAFYQVAASVPTDLEGDSDPELTVNEDEFMEAFGVLPTQDLVLFYTYQGETDSQLLADLKPSFVVLYDPNPMFIRQLELFQTTHPGHPLRVYFLVYENSVEEQLYLSAVRKEKDAYEKLVHEKSVMVIPLEVNPSRDSAQHQREFELLRTLNTKIAGGGRLTVQDEPAKVVIDMREFRSPLPSLLHAHGFVLQPCTLLVGDYVLSPNICVERKSIADLISSFSSGRLYAQVEAMLQYYTVPVLLIEFEEGRSFSLQAMGDMKSDIALTDVSSKLVLLTLAFPTLRILWSASPRTTVDMFQDLKLREDEPDMDIAMRLGADTEAEINTTNNITPQEILRSMPGITSKNYRVIVNNVSSIEELCRLPQTRLKELLGNLAGQRLYEFIHKGTAKQ
ncbi:DNA repair protein RAD16 [Dimargaris xerosporica]|nr:DNA repair protein RAD16 [Dimargaris xerosporica]